MKAGPSCQLRATGMLNLSKKCSIVLIGILFKDKRVSGSV